ncbi:IclR family transcriptional regulator [Ancrocorticia sp.]|uniref:IclR family transcriptional regulator n=1 Tax=Ancrocorticia sp. TaxID=2593684 RepID=UPI003F9186BA
MARANDRSSPLQTVDRALEVLLSYSEGRPDWGVLELAEVLGIDKSSAHRILAALAARRFLYRDPVSRRYRLGPAVWRMASLWNRTRGLESLTRGVLEPLAIETKRTALFAIPDGLHVRCVTAVDGGASIRNHPLVGELYPANAGATSRGYFGFLDANERRTLTSGRVFAKFTELTESDENAVEQLFTSTAHQGYAYSDGEYDYGTRALALPIRIRKRPVGSLSVVEGKHPCPSDSLLDYLPHLHVVAGEISALLEASTTSQQHAER